MALTLKSYLDIKKQTSLQLAREIGRSRQNIDYWSNADAHVELTIDGKANIDKIIMSKTVFAVGDAA